MSKFSHTYRENNGTDDCLANLGNGTDDCLANLGCQKFNWWHDPTQKIQKFKNVLVACGFLKYCFS